MKSKINKLKKIINKSDFTTDKTKLLIYMSICFLRYKSKDVANYLKVEDKVVDNALSLNGVRLYNDKKFVEKLKTVINTYNSQLELNV